MEVPSLSSTNQVMRIMHIASGDLWAGAEVQLYTLVKTLAAMEGNELYAVLMNEGELARRLRDTGVSVFVIEESQHSSWQIFRHLQGLMGQIKPHIIHTHRLKENILGALANHFSVRAYSLRTVHGAPEFSYSFYKQTAKWFISRLDQWVGRYLQSHVIAVSQPLADQLSDKYPPEHIRVVLNGVDEAALGSVQSLGFDDAGFEGDSGVKHIGMVGRLVAVKRVDIFLAMAKTLIESGGSEYRFHIVGDGPLLEMLKSQATNAGLEGKVIFYGHRGDVAKIIKGLDVLVMCSDHEGLPMTALESLALGVPIVAHAVGGLVPLLSGVDGCALVSRHRYEAYVEAVLSLLDSAGREDLVLPLKYSARGNAQAMVQVYSEGIECLK